MKILVDERWLGPTGIGRYASEVLKRRPKDWEVIPLSEPWAIKNPVSPWLLSSRIRAVQPDLFWSPGFMPPAPMAVRSVVTIHDLIHLHYGSRLHKVYYNLVIKPFLRSVATVLTDSEYSRNELLTWSGLPKHRVVTVPLAAANIFDDAGDIYSPGYRYVLYVGNRRPYKNVQGLIRAFAAASLDDDIRLVISGVKEESVIREAHNAGIQSRIECLGLIPDAMLPSVYRGALAFLYLSFYEGFGLPPLEAMACGTPTIVSNLTSLPEVVGNGAVQVNPHSVDEVADALRMVIGDPDLWTDLKIKGIEQAKRFSWERTAQMTWALLEAAARE